MSAATRFLLCLCLVTVAACVDDEDTDDEGMPHPQADPVSHGGVWVPPAAESTAPAALPAAALPVYAPFPPPGIPFSADDYAAEGLPVPQGVLAAAAEANDSATHPANVEVTIDPVPGGFVHRCNIDGPDVGIGLAFGCPQHLMPAARWHNGVVNIEFESIDYLIKLRHAPATGHTRMSMQIKGKGRGFGKAGTAAPPAPIGGWATYKGGFGGGKGPGAGGLGGSGVIA